MKRISAAILSIILILALPCFCFADVDLSGMSYDELVALKEQINLAIWNCEEWQQVTVPQGVWEVGTDIPAGKWTLTAPDQGEATIYVGKSVDASGTEVEDWDVYERVTSETYRHYEKDDRTSLTVELHDGDFVQVDRGDIIFNTYSGKPSLGFK